MQNDGNPGKHGSQKGTLKIIVGSSVERKYVRILPRPSEVHRQPLSIISHRAGAAPSALPSNSRC